MKMLKILIFLPVLLSIAIYFGLNYNQPRVKTPQDLDSVYDYIIIGGGTAGCVLAARLSENSDVTVLLIEAGGEENVPFYTHIPGVAPFLQQTEVDWQYFTVPQTNCCDGLINNQARWARGKILGGSSVLNYMLYIRGNHLDYDHWKELGNVGWSYEAVLPYFKKAEAMTIEHLKSSQYHGAKGPIVVTEGFQTTLGKVFAEAIQHLGLPLIDDVNGAHQLGFSSSHFTIHDGKRMSTAYAYLRPAMTRNNLHVLTKSHVTKILFDTNGTDIRAQGVNYLYNGEIDSILSKKEVILSAGAIGSPHILMLSGIGPREQLEKFNIPLVQNLPAVGQNMKDHFGLQSRYSVNEPITLDTSGLGKFPDVLKIGLEYYWNKSGILSFFPMDYVGFLHSGIVQNKLPDLQFFLIPVDPFQGDSPKLLNFNDHVKESVQIKTEGAFGFCMGADLLHPRSTGEITLQSSDPLVPPLINPKYFSDETDLDVLVDGLKFLDVIAKTPPMQKYNVKKYEGSLEACSNFLIWSDDYIRCLAKHRPFIMFHTTGTCRMGVSLDDSVVDHELRVHGVKGLRIVDASIFPDQISGNTYNPVIMVAEKAADFIKQSSLN